VMHGSVIATIQPAYKRGSASTPLSPPSPPLSLSLSLSLSLGDLRFIAPGRIADSQIPRFALINDSY
jgi:hypothetical protein